ncbi:hypothetical protein MUY35_16795 [Aliiroseovarius sp. S1339]|uniref:baeRF11 domain-containing protein n=1 Tax=Aliiroseovarius sp. S1339 TaxID=2936990 RepID=UPI0020BD93ED|nr:hypothetical protein [Aliiroseovarius sp. S1339]MCK8465520.1 hypothetical protein [Aliiroseovarius sp. S1339]
MLYIDLPTPHEIGKLHLVRSDACISIYLATTPLTQEIGNSRTTLRQLVKTAIQQLEAAEIEKRRIWLLEENFDTILEDDEYWEHQAHSLAILATPEKLLTYRLANKLVDTVAVSDRFHLKPLLRATTFPNAAHILAVSENAVRLVEISSDLPATEIRVPNMPKDAASAVGKASINDSGAGRRIHGKEGQKVRLGQYIRKVDAALHPVLAGSEIPLILASTLPVASLFRSLSRLSLLDDMIEMSPDQMTDAELAHAARPILDAHYAQRIAEFQSHYDANAAQSRATTDISDAARAATFGGVETLLVDMDAVIPGTVDETSGVVNFAPDAGADSYGVVDEIAGRALRTGARVVAVRKQDIPGEMPLAAILRYAV